MRDDNIAYHVDKDTPIYEGNSVSDVVNGCSAAATTFSITPNGELQPCCAFPMSFGNINERTIEMILKENQLLKEWRKVTLRQYEECGKHEYCGYCNLCAGNNYIEHKDYRKAAETNCYMAKIRCRLAKRLMQGDDSLYGQDFVSALQALPKTKADLRRIYDTKGINGVSHSTPVTD